MYKKILVPLDGSRLAEQIIPFVRWIAALNHIPVELLTAINPDAHPPLWPSEVGLEYLQRIAHEHFPEEITPTTVVGIGEPPSIITDLASENPDFLIAMATHGMSGIRRWLLGSVASKVIQSAANPLLLIRPTDHADPAVPIEINTIFVPLDGSALAEKALRHVIALVKSMEASVQLLRIYTLPSSAYVVADGVIAQGPTPYREEMYQEAQGYLDGKVAELQAKGLKSVIGTAIQGDPAGEIVDLSRRTDHNLIAMCTHARAGIGRWVLGSVAERVVQHSRDPVLLIRGT